MTGSWRRGLAILPAAAILSLSGCATRDVDARVGAELFRGMIRAANSLRPREETLDELVSEIVGIFTHGIERDGR